MTKNIMTKRNEIVQQVIELVPQSIRLIANPNRRITLEFVQEISKNIKFGSKVLDAGAGPCPYKKFFTHCNYEATDFIDKHNILDFVCSLDNIPKEDNTYDAILCTDVLEHVEYPQKVINEFYRVLKKGGKLYMTIPHEWKIHQAPYNFYYFTKYGIKSLVQNARFKEFNITPKGGFFSLLLDTIRFNGILEQHKKYWFLYYPLKCIEFPITNIVLPLIFYPLDFLDKEKEWTLGYILEAKK